METLRLISRLTLFALFLALTAVLAASVLMAELVARRPIDRAPYARFCFNGAARCLGFRMTLHGELAREPVLFVSNHISWSDIPILGGMTPLRFLSKAEVGRWPVIGWLAVQAGTLFIQRGSGKALKTRQEITGTLRQGQSVLVFPEGTTTSGLTVLPFHTRLLHSAAEADVPIQPISIGYLRDGQPDHLAPFIGDDEFHHHLLRMLRQPAVEVGVIFHPTVRVTDDQSVEDLASRLHGTVVDGLKRIHQGQADFAPEPVPSVTAR